MKKDPMVENARFRVHFSFESRGALAVCLGYRNPTSGFRGLQDCQRRLGAALLRAWVDIVNLSDKNGANCRKMRR